MKRILETFIYALAGILVISACKGEGKSQNESQGVVDTPAIENEPTGEAIAFADPAAGGIFEGYQKVRKALVASDVSQTAAAAAELATSISDEYPEIRKSAMEIATAEALSDQRMVFAALSAQVEPLFQQTLTSGTVYKQFCPMAFEGEGGYWLSDTDAIRNPYYGDQMLKCGKVVTEISN